MTVTFLPMGGKQYVLELPYIRLGSSMSDVIRTAMDIEHSSNPHTPVYLEVPPLKKEKLDVNTPHHCCNVKCTGLSPWAYLRPIWASFAYSDYGVMVVWKVDKEALLKDWTQAGMPKIWHVASPLSFILRIKEKTLPVNAVEVKW